LDRRLNRSQPAAAAAATLATALCPANRSLISNQGTSATVSHRVTQSPGTRHGAHRTSLGKAILAFLPKSELEARLHRIDFTPATPNSITSLTQLRRERRTIRVRRYAIDNEESDLGVRCVGAPIFGADDAPIAGLSIEGPTERLSEERLAEIGRDVLAAADACSLILAKSPAGLPD
jgi:IclR family acetate operon transcriptional repressor